MIKKKKKSGGRKKNMLTPKFSRVSCQPVSKARCARQAIDWLHWSQLLEVSAEAPARAHTLPHKQIEPL